MQNFRCVLATDLHPVRMTRAPLQPTCAQREFFTIFPMVTCSTDGVLSTCVVRAWSCVVVRGPCLLRTSQVQLSNEQTELTWTVPSKHVLCTYNGQAWRAGHVLTTCATVRLTCVYILPLCSCHSLTTFSEKNVGGLASPKNVRKKTAGWVVPEALQHIYHLRTLSYVMMTQNHLQRYQEYQTQQTY